MLNEMIAARFTAASLACCLIAGCGSQGATSTTTPPITTSSCSVPTTTFVHNGSATNQPQQVVVNTQTYPKAVCNDGSPAVYVIRKGSGAAANRWVISLEGGGFCTDAGECAARAAHNPGLVSSNPAVANPGIHLAALQGIQSSDPSANPDFYDATQVSILYCSSDAWSGNQTASGAFNTAVPSTWNFQGHAIIQAVLQDLKTRMGMSSATEVLFTGLSAGGVGVFVNVNDVAAAVPSGARFVAATDGAFSNDVSNYSATGSAPNYLGTYPANSRVEESAGRLLWNGTGESHCVASATTSAALDQCYYGQSLLSSSGSITLPMMVTISENDTAELGADGVSQTDIANGSLTPSETAYASYFAAQMRAGLNATKPVVSVYSPDALIHTEEDSNQGFNTSYTFSSGSATNQQVVSAWYQNPCTAQRKISGN